MDRFFWLMCITCGAAVGMVLSSWPVCILIPLAAWLRLRPTKGSPNTTRRYYEGLRTTSLQLAGMTTLGLLTAAAVYVATNPYVVINLFVNRGVLRSNFGNSLAMYEVSRIGEGLLRVLDLTIEGATVVAPLLGSVALVAGMLSRARHAAAFWLLVIPAALFFLQFALIGAGKPAEYGRFGIFTNTALVIGCALILNGRWAANAFGTLVFCGIVFAISTGGLGYLHGFRADAQGVPTRLEAAKRIEGMNSANTSVLVPVEPAPYSCPPLNFSSTRVYRASEKALDGVGDPYLMVYIDDRLQRTGISWANKRIEVRYAPPKSWRPPLEIDDD